MDFAFSATAAAKFYQKKAAERSTVGDF